MVNQNHSLAVPVHASNDSSLVTNYQNKNNYSRDVSNYRREVPDPRYDTTGASDDLILDIRVQREPRKHRLLSQSNNTSYQELDNHYASELPEVDDRILYGGQQIEHSRRGLRDNSGIYDVKAMPVSNKHANKKFPVIKKAIKTNKTSKSLKPITKTKNLPHYMQLRQQDVDNKYQAKAKIRSIKKDKPRIHRTPGKKWIPVKIEPKGAALNARFFKKKTKPSYKISRNEQENSMARLKKFKQNPHADFDRSESHCRRCEACRNKRDALIKYNNKLKSQIQEASSSGNEQDLEEEEKDIFEEEVSQHHESRELFSGLQDKLNRAFGQCIDDHESSPPNRSNKSLTPQERLPEADIAKVGFRPNLSKKSRLMKKQGESSNNSRANSQLGNNRIIEGTSSASPKMMNNVRGLNISSPTFMNNLGGQGDNSPAPETDMKRGNNVSDPNLSNTGAVKNAPQAHKNNLERINDPSQPYANRLGFGTSSASPTMMNKVPTVATLMNPLPYEETKTGPKHNEIAKPLVDQRSGSGSAENDKNSKSNHRNNTASSKNPSHKATESYVDAPIQNLKNRPGSILIIENKDQNKNSSQGHRSDLSRNQPRKVDETAQTMKPSQDLPRDDTKDEGIQADPELDQLEENNAKKDIGTQFTFEDQKRQDTKEPIILATGENDPSLFHDGSKEKLSEKVVDKLGDKSPKELEEDQNAFEDSKQAPFHKTISDSEDKKDSEKTTENNKDSIKSFDSRKTSLQRLSQATGEGPSVPGIVAKERDTENTETRDEDRQMMNTSRTDHTLLNTDRYRKKYHDIENLALFTLKDWKDSKIYDWYTTATKEQREDFINHVIARENEESGNPIQVLDYDTLTYILNFINSREYSMKRHVKEQKNEDGTISSQFVKFDVYNVLELFETLKRTISFVYGLFGLDTYILHRVYGIYHQEDDKLFRTTENATKLCIRCKLGYEMIGKWTDLIDVISERNNISQSVWNIIHEVTDKNVMAKQKEEDRILKGIEDLIAFNKKISEEVEKLANSEFKMLFMVATFRSEETDDEGKPHITYRRKRGFIFDNNDYYTLDYSNTKTPTQIYNKKYQLHQYPGSDYLIKDLQALKKQFMLSYEMNDDQ